MPTATSFAPRIIRLQIFPPIQRELSLGFWKEGALRFLLVPGGLLLLAAVVVFSGALPPIPPSAVDLYYYAVFGMGLLLAWRFHSGRVLFSLLTLLLAQRALQFYAGPKLPHFGPGHVAFEVLSFLVPLNLVVLGFVRERGLGISVSGPRLIALFVQSVVVAVVCRPGQLRPTSAFASPVSHSQWFGWTAITRPSLLIFLVAAIALLIRALLVRKPVELGFFWSLISVSLTFHFGAVGRVPTGYMATAGLFLLVAMVETSYSMAYNDELTTLPARRAFNETIAALEAHYSLAIVDVDHFKQFNDTYGHETGDQVLRMVARQLARVTGGGKAFRCGGEEFAVIFPEKSVKDAVEHLEVLRESIAGSIFYVRAQERRLTPRQEPDRREGSGTKRRRSAGQKSPAQAGLDGLSVTVSIGVAEPGAKHREVDQVIAAADKALYRAKAKGRNRVETASSSRMRLLRKPKQSIA
jgi:diguanylate cyclase (GGDEF)-like protein